MTPCILINPGFASTALWCGRSRTIFCLQGIGSVVCTEAAVTRANEQEEEQHQPEIWGKQSFLPYQSKSSEMMHFIHSAAVSFISNCLCNLVLSEWQLWVSRQGMKVIYPLHDKLLWKTGIRRCLSSQAAQEFVTPPAPPPKLLLWRFASTAHQTDWKWKGAHILNSHGLIWNPGLLTTSSVFFIPNATQVYLLRPRESDFFPIIREI